MSHAHELSLTELKRFRTRYRAAVEFARLPKHKGGLGYKDEEAAEWSVKAADQKVTTEDLISWIDKLKAAELRRASKRSLLKCCVDKLRDVVAGE